MFPSFPFFTNVPVPYFELTSIFKTHRVNISHVFSHQNPSTTPPLTNQYQFDGSALFHSEHTCFITKGYSPKSGLTHSITNMARQRWLLGPESDVLEMVVVPDGWNTTTGMMATTRLPARRRRRRLVLRSYPARGHPKDNCQPPWLGSRISGSEYNRRSSYVKA